jgi:acetyl esterase/lipase
MSLIRPLLNVYLRATEKPFLSRVQDPGRLRRSFDRKAKLFFRGPRGVDTHELDLGGRPALGITPKGAETAPVVFYLHGGAHVFGSPKSYEALVKALCKAAGTRGIVPSYRKAPEHPFPAAVEDVMRVWDALLDRGEQPERIILGGDSAGGNLCLSLLARLLSRGGPLPAGAFAFSPLTDLTFSGESVVSNAQADVVLPASRASEMAQAYLNGHPGDDPVASPLFADFTGAPPIWLTVGDTEVLRDDTIRFAQNLQTSQVPHEVHVEHDLPHVWPMFHNTLPEARQTLRNLATWIRRLPIRSDES